VLLIFVNDNDNDNDNSCYVKVTFVHTAVCTACHCSLFIASFISISVLSWLFNIF